MIGKKFDRLLLLETAEVKNSNVIKWILDLDRKNYFKLCFISTNQLILIHALKNAIPDITTFLPFDTLPL